MESKATIPSAWNLFGNPIFRRFCRSRLRMSALVPVLVVVIACSTFLYLVPYLYSLTKGDMTPVAAARLALWPIFILQAFILMLLGTGAVGSGLSQENDDGMTEYQRLTPMSPAAKIVGYLFGLPVREWVMFLCTMPFLLYAGWAGEIPGWVLLRFYTVFFSSVLLYHLAGLVAGSVFKKKAAGRMAQLLVVLLYFVVPRLSLFGFGAFYYFTTIPEFMKDLAPALLSSVNRPGRLPVEFLPGEPVFFGFEFTVTQFSIFVQAGLILGFVAILARKWRNIDHHVFSKPQAVAGMAWLALLLLGSSLPLIPTGSIFPLEAVRRAANDQRLERAIEEEIRRRGGSPPQSPRNVAWRKNLENLSDGGNSRLAQAALVSSFFGLLCLIGGVYFVTIFTPTRDEYLTGLRRAKKCGKTWAPPASDEAGGFWWMLSIGAVGAGAWLWFNRELFGSKWFSANPLGQQQEYQVLAALLLPLWCYQLLLEQHGKARAFLFSFFCWIIPVCIGILLLVTKNIDLAIHTMGISAIILPFFAMVATTGLGDPLKVPTVDLAVREAIYIYSVLALALFFYRLAGTLRARRSIS